MAGEATRKSAEGYVLGRLVLDYIRAFMWPLVALVVVLVYQNDVRTLVFEREIDVFGVRIGAKVEQIESQALAEIADVRVLLEAQQSSGDSAGNPEIARDIEAKLETLERNLSREIAEVQSVQQTRRPSPVPERTAPPAAAVNATTLAAAAERRGFEALVAHDIAAAIAAFDEARRALPTYRNVAEIGNALRRWEDRLKDPESPMWAQLYREILTRYSWGLPEDLRTVIRRGAKQAY
ncbi:hypothetical protein [Pelagibius sp.]|uniref:hypothetical protein n=1 Tax=Pelagibius sp. TaxID=1931238 RepID=UPI00261AF96A|nr:hypothetical protein [Pelagibius sp.]